MFCEGVSKRDVLVAAALATKWREPPKDALDTLVLNAIDLSPLDMYEQVEQIPFDTSLKRTEATIRRKDGSVFRVRSWHELGVQVFPHLRCESSECRLREERRLRNILTAHTLPPTRLQKALHKCC